MEEQQYNEVVTLIVKMDSRLSLIEVKGDSVEHLLTARILLKQLNEEIEKLKTKNEDKEKLEKEG